MPPTITFKQLQYSPQKDETVLDCLIRNNLDLPYGCKAGACQACMMQIKQGHISQQAQHGLTSAQKKLGYFLPCSCTLANDIEISAATDNNHPIATRVIDVNKTSKHVVCLRLEKTIDFQAGQFISIWLDQHASQQNGSRSYSIASLPSEGFIELHVKKIAGGVFSEFAYDTLQGDDILTISGPMGHCVYATDDPHEDLLLCGIGTGLAPLYGIVKDAIEHMHMGTVNLVLGARDSSQFYLVEALLALAKTHMNIHVHFIAQDAQHAFAKQGDLYDFVKDIIPNPQKHRIYLCGAESFVQKMRKQCFLAGAAMDHIHTDVFLPSGT